MLIYSCNYFCSASQVMVFRLGGISTEASVVKVQNGMYRIVASNTDHSFGGDGFTEVLVNFLAQDFQRYHYILYAQTGNFFLCSPNHDKQTTTFVISSLIYGTNKG